MKRVQAFLQKIITPPPANLQSSPPSRRVNLKVLPTSTPLLRKSDSHWIVWYNSPPSINNHRSDGELQSRDMIHQICRSNQERSFFLSLLRQQCIVHLPQPNREKGYFFEVKKYSGKGKMYKNLSEFFENFQIGWGPCT